MSTFTIVMRGGRLCNGETSTRCLTVSAAQTPTLILGKSGGTGAAAAAAAAAATHYVTIPAALSVSSLIEKDHVVIRLDRGLVEVDTPAKAHVVRLNRHPLCRRCHAKGTQWRWEGRFSPDEATQTIIQIDNVLVGIRKVTC